MSRLAELHAMNASLAAFNAGISSHFSRTRPMQEMLTPHDFETQIKGVDVVVHYDTRWDKLDCVDEIVYQSVKVHVAGTDITPMLPNELVNGLRHQVEADWERIGQEAQEDYQ